MTGSSATFTWAYDFQSNGGNELDDLAMSLCPDVLSHFVSATPSGQAFVNNVPQGHPGFGPGIRFQTSAASGTLTVVFDQAFPPDGSIRLQSHSGDGNDGDAITTAAGPGTCAPTTTTTLAPTTTTTLAPTTTTTLAPTTTTTLAPTTTTTLAPTTTTTVAPTTTSTTLVSVTTTSVGQTTTSKPPATTTTGRQGIAATGGQATTTTLAPATTTTVAPVSADTTTSVAVLASRQGTATPSPRLAKTGVNGAPLVAFGLIAVALGGALLAGGMLERDRD